MTAIKSFLRMIVTAVSILIIVALIPIMIVGLIVAFVGFGVFLVGAIPAWWIAECLYARVG